MCEIATSSGFFTMTIVGSPRRAARTTCADACVWWADRTGRSWASSRQTTAYDDADRPKPSITSSVSSPISRSGRSRCFHAISLRYGW